MSKKFNRDEQSDAKDDKIDNIVETDPKLSSMDKQMDVKVGDSTFDNGKIKEVESTGEKTKTSQAAEVVTGSSNSAVSAGGTSLQRAVVFGGGAGTDIGSDVSATTKADTAYRSGSRTGKRLDPVTRKIDFNYPEQVKVSYKQSKPLSETTEKQGYNGNYMDEHAITQKVSGGAPGDPMFNRSVDLITMDMGYFTEGQYNNKLDNYGEFAVKSFVKGTGGADDSYVELTHKKGNYLIQDIIVKFNDNGAVGLDYNEVDLANRNVSEAVSRLSGDAALRVLNQNELDRLDMVSKAGNESDPSWCPLGDAIVSATAVNHYLREIDAYAGDNIFMSERKVAEALAYAINKSAKDGIRVVGPMAELCNGNIEGQYSTAIKSAPENGGREQALSNGAYRAGGAGLWLAINDSLPKYTTKGKMLTLPLSFKNALNTVKANRDVFRMHETLFKDVRHAELFSTIDKGYDPFLPIVATDKAALIHPVSAKDTAVVTITTTTTAAENKMNPIFTYHYENLRNKYNIPVYNFFFQGLHDYFKANANRIIEKLEKGADGLYTLTIPVQSSMTSLSLWDLFVCSATPYMVSRRQTSLVDIIKYQNNFGYPYSGIISLKEVDSNEALNYGFTDTESALTSKIANPIDAIKVKFPEVFWTVECSAYEDHALGGSHKLMASKTVLPHYFNQNQFENDSDKLLRLSDEASNISYPSTRSGVMLSDMDVIYGMSEEDYRLALDRMTVYPGYNRARVAEASGDNEGPEVFKSVWITEGNNHYEVEESLTYKYGMTGDGIPTLPYLTAAQSSDEYDRCLTILDVMRTPRELGLHFVMPAGVLTPVRDVRDPSNPVANFRNINSGYLAVSGPGFTAYIYHADGKAMQDAILQDADYEISRNAAYKNDYTVIQATPNNEIDDCGMILSISRGIKATSGDHTFVLDSGSLDFVPFAKGSYGAQSYDESNGFYSSKESQATTLNNHLNVISLQKYFWARIQRLPFVINPFDANASDLSYHGTAQRGNKYDIYDLLYFFGFCGFRASDYHELTYERNRQRIALGMNYVNDPYIDKTLLLK